MLSKIKKLMRAQLINLKRKIRSSVHSNLLPETSLHDDTYLVSFPRSGVTWLSFLMANVHLKCSEVDVRATFFNTDNYIPDIHQSRALKREILPFPGFRVIKSHSEHNPFYRKIIYLIRDPRDVMVSYYHFTTEDVGLFKGTLSEMLRSEVYGISAWCRHVGGWFDRIEPSQLINFIRYEDMKADAKSILERIYRLFGANVSEEVLSWATNTASLQAMKDDEEYYSAGNPTIDPSVRFVRKGMAGGHKTELAVADIRYIEKIGARWMDLFGYPTS